MTITIDILNEQAVPLLFTLEKLHLIKFNKQKSAVRKHAVRLSKHFAGALRLSDKQHNKLQTAVATGRKKWNRNIY
jgi:hypothetical protein